MRCKYFAAIVPVLLLVFSQTLWCQQAEIKGKVSSPQGPVTQANVLVKGNSLGALTDEEGRYQLFLEPGEYEVSASFIGMTRHTQKIKLKAGQVEQMDFFLEENAAGLDEVVVSGTLKEVRRSESPVPVEVYSAKFFDKNPTPNLYEAVQNINGVRPQLNCNVCNTGDIHINGLEGPYTMVLIDGMPIVSGLSTVYGLMGIPRSMIDRLEVVKGPASSLYGSEAVGGLINVITVMPEFAPVFSADVMASSWQEYNADIGLRNKVGDKRWVLTGINLFNYTNPIDNNGDNFTDVTLQERASIFQKWDLSQTERIFTLAGRYFYEDRYGGEMQWTPEDRGGDQVYGESIITKRWELTGQYQLPLEEKMILWASYNHHNQNSYYGDVGYFADQRITFSQLTWDKELNHHSLLAGTSFRYTYYNDNTAATIQPDHTFLPGLFLQDEISLNYRHKLLLGTRYDYHSSHGNIFTPRLAYKWSLKDNKQLRLNAGTGFRVVNLFTEEHAALTGAREVLITEELEPEESYNVNLNYVQKWFFDKSYLSLDGSVWYTHFTNQIIPDYDTDPDLIIYDNLDGYSVSQGVSVNLEAVLQSGISVRAGASYMDIYTAEENESGETTFKRPILAEEWTGTWAVSYQWYHTALTFDYTGNLYGPMRLPLLGALDPRDEYSPWWSIQNIQVTWAPRGKSWELYGGVKNLLNFTPPSNSIARPQDPFDREVVFDSDGNPLPSAGNPYALTFDPSYVYAPNQGIRGFLGFRYRFERNEYE
ncbi:MAG: TonB-dependent receptor [Owenweeksia sp.]